MTLISLGIAVMGLTGCPAGLFHEHVSLLVSLVTGKIYDVEEMGNNGHPSILSCE